MFVCIKLPNYLTSKASQASPAHSCFHSYVTLVRGGHLPIVKRSLSYQCVFCASCAPWGFPCRYRIVSQWTSRFTVADSIGLTVTLYYFLVGKAYSILQSIHVKLVDSRKIFSVVDGLGIWPMIFSFTSSPLFLSTCFMRKYINVFACIAFFFSCAVEMFFFYESNNLHIQSEFTI